MLDWILAHYQEVLLVWAPQVLALAWLIAKLTPTKADDEALNFIEKALDALKRVLSTGK